MATVSPKEPWQDVVARKRAECEAKIPEKWRIPQSLLLLASENYVEDFPAKSGMFTDRELLIIESTALVVFKESQ
jgi:amidase